jgi:hypothetical protein
MKNKSLLLIFTLLFTPLGLNLWAQSPDQLSLAEYLESGKEENSVVFFQGEDYGIQLRDNEFQGLDDTDALFHFNQHLQDLAQNYTVISNRARITDRFSRLGRGSLVFQEKGGVQLEAKPGSLFYPGSLWNDFSMEFWLYSANLEDGEMIFLWQGGSQLLNSLNPRASEDQRNAFFNQEIRAQVENRKLVWYFQNFFLSGQGPSGELKLEGSHSLIPRQWSHHKILFDSATGRLEYRIDHLPEAILVVTEDGSYDSPPLKGFTGESSQPYIEVGSNFIGFLDEMRISTVLREGQPDGDFYPQGEWTSPIISLADTNTRLDKLHYETDLPEGSGYEIFYKISNDLSLQRAARSSRILTSIPEDVPWKRLPKDSRWPEDAKGKHLQLFFRLFSNARNTATPKIMNLKLDYFRDPPPPVPGSPRAVAYNGRVMLSWLPVFQEDLREYRIYFGTHPDDLGGQTSTGLTSPIILRRDNPELYNTGSRLSYELKGLENNTLYYFSLVSMDEAGHFSTGTHIFTARPQELLE